MSGQRIVVVNSSHPELDELAGELGARGLLHQYFGRYFPNDRAWERAVQGFGPTRKVFQAGPGRRVAPSGLNQAETFQAGALLDFAAGAVPRNRFKGQGEQLFRWLMLRRDRAIIRAAVSHYDNQDAVIANFSVGVEIFRKARAAGRLAILNSPLANAIAIDKILTEEAAMHPEFAEDIAGQGSTAARHERLEEEISLADRILVGSEFAKQTFVDQGVPAEKIFASTYGVDVEQFASAGDRVPDGTFRAIFVGQITQRKGIKYLLEAWKGVHGPGTELVLAGHFMAAKSPCEPYAPLFRYAGFLNADGLRALFHQADVLVLPTLAEGMPLVVLQAMAARVPVIVTPNGPGDVVRDGIDGFVVPIRDVEAIRDKLLYLRDHPEHRLEMGRQAQERALTFTWARFRKETADWVESLLATA